MKFHPIAVVSAAAAPALVPFVRADMRPNEWKSWAHGEKGIERALLRHVDNVFDVNRSNRKHKKGKGDDDRGGPDAEIINGMDVDPRKYGYFAYLGGCGGSLVTPNVVLSAAHCYNYADKVTLGLHSYSVSDPDEFDLIETIKVAERERHPQYNSQTLDNDFMLVRLERRSSLYNQSIVELDTPFDTLNLTDGDVLIVMGFGKLKANGGQYADTLQEVEVDYIPNDLCGDYDDIFDSMLCAGRDNVDSCQGDSGGPIIHKTTGKQVGVVSWGYGCADFPKYPGVYSRVSYLAAYDWMVTVIADWASIADAPTSPPGDCVDSPKNWFDSDGPIYDCPWYDQGNNCGQYGDGYANGGMTAKDACCACGGGSAANDPPSDPPPATTTTTTTLPPCHNDCFQCSGGGACKQSPASCTWRKGNCINKN